MDSTQENPQILETSHGLSGMLRMFKATMTSQGMNPGDKIVFVGSAGTCVPFIELFAYTIRDSKAEMVLVPDGVLDDSRAIWWIPEIGMQIGGAVDPANADFVILLGGLSMPQSKIGAEGTNDVVKKILKPGGKVFGICFMDMFAKAGWYGKVPFDLVMDATIDPIRLQKLN
ncbi:DUF2124 domain-containing protein [Methanocella sp. CWC-04]|uniref:DUF2124 domain-containing protein n=1 Tax=Methanooceanicella nereidis TaxID=2052831 RepID=A0AAP2RBA4_9EURY|nr:DUF2124 domain-containing protein [Methanocella sp. CWC-04]MCD1294243.1 DUF2124 domain-containing protein [Methanocella sp. CWC-04]